jgi:hypothetical protein
MEGVPEIVKFLGWVGSVLATVFWAAVRFAKLEFGLAQSQKDIIELKDHIQRRAMVEALQTENLVRNSPVRVPDRVLEIFGPTFIQELRTWYAEHKKFLLHDEKDRRLFWMIEKKFGERLAIEICPKTGMNVGGCVQTAMEICRIPDPKAESEGEGDTHHDATD